MGMLVALGIVLGIALSATMSLAWRVALRTGRSGWIDAIWSFAVGMAGVVGSLVPGDHGADVSARQVLVALMVASWSLRLGVHIAVRTSYGSGDDPRYRQLREEWRGDFPRRLFWFLQIQAAVALVLALAVSLAAHRPAPGLDVRDYFGALILLVAIVGETVADRQLSGFRKNLANKNAIYDVGLWRFSRHPNYFFEWLGWTAYAVIAIDVAGQYPYGWAALAAPILMYWLLVHVSGVPPLEAHMLRAHGDRFREYQDRTNAFWLGPPRLSSTDRHSDRPR